MCEKDAVQMLKKIESSQIGFNATLQGPYGSKRSKSTFLYSNTDSGVGDVH